MLYLCPKPIEITESKQPFVLEKELKNLIGKQRAMDVIKEIKSKFNEILPIHAERIVYSGDIISNEKGDLLTYFENHKEEFFYLIVFKKIIEKENAFIEQTYYYVFN